MDLAASALNFPDVAPRGKYCEIRAIVDAAIISRLRAHGRTTREIAETLGMSRSLVHKTLANRESIGAEIKAV